MEMQNKAKILRFQSKNKDCQKNKPNSLPGGTFNWVPEYNFEKLLDEMISFWVENILSR